MSAKNNPRIIPGKPGTSGEGLFFLATFHGQEVAQAFLEQHGAVRAGGRDDITLWRLPDGTCEKGAETVLGHVLDVLAESSRRLDYTQRSAEIKESMGDDAIHPLTPAGGHGLAGVSVDVRGGGQESLGVGKDEAGKCARPDTEDRLGYGYRMGMSVAERDMYRAPVPVGATRIGETLEINGVVREIVMMSGVLHVTGDAGDYLKQRFPECGLEKDAAFQFAMWAVDPAPEISPVP